MVDRHIARGSGPAGARRRSIRLRLGTTLVLAFTVACAGLAAIPASGTAGVQATTQFPDLLASWTVRYIPSQLNAFAKNIIRPAQLINGTVVQPGAQFNFVKVAGPFNNRNGYFTGAAIVRGKVKEDGVLGGGLCSAATTLFNAAVRAGLAIDSRANHRFYISRYPIGLDATIWVYGRRAVRNVVFTNDMAYPIEIRASATRRRVTFEVWGTLDGRSVSFSEPAITNLRPAGTQVVYSDKVKAGKRKEFLPPSDGFLAVVTRSVVGADGSIIHSDTFRSNYSPMTGIIYLGRRAGDPKEGTIYETIPPPPVPPTPAPSESPTAAPTPSELPAPTPFSEAPTAAPTESPTDTPAVGP